MEGWGAPSVAVAGNPSAWSLATTWTPGGRCSTADPDSQYWQVDLGSEQFIKSIKYTGRSDCCDARADEAGSPWFDRNKGVRIRLLTDKFLAGANCVGPKPPTRNVTATLYDSELTQTIPINKKGRFVRLRGSLISGDGYLQIGYLRVNDKNGNNISEGKTTFATQNKIVLESQTAATNAIIGTEGPRGWAGFDNNYINPNNIYHAKAPNTYKDDSPYWQVDLGSEQEISTIVYHGRTDCCREGSEPDRITGIRIEVANTPVALPFNPFKDQPIYNQNFYQDPTKCRYGTTLTVCDNKPYCLRNDAPTCLFADCPPNADPSICIRALANKVYTKDIGASIKSFFGF